MGVGFNITGIRTEQFAIFPEHLNIHQEAQVSHSFQFMSNPQLQQVGVFAAFDFKQQSRIVMRITVSCHFGIGISAWHNFVNGNTLCLPLDFAINLSVITASTARGILASKTEHTPFANYILPLLDIKNIITDDVVFQLY